MATSAQRRLDPTDVRRYGSGRDQNFTPDLTEIQTKSYAEFLQKEVAADKRKEQGIESVLREIFPIESYDKTLNVELRQVRTRESLVTHLRNAGSLRLDLRHAVPRVAAFEQGAAS